MAGRKVREVAMVKATAMAEEMRQAVEEGDAEGELAEQGDAHRDPGEQDGAS